MTLRRRLRCKPAWLGFWALPLLAMPLLMGCPKFVSDFDPVTFQNLVEMKVEVLDLYAGWDAPELDTKQIKAVELKFKKILEYERQKGASNQKTFQQLELIHSLFTAQVKNRTGSSWNPHELPRFRDEIVTVFDEAIRVEKLKPRYE